MIYTNQARKPPGFIQSTQTAWEVLISDAIWTPLLGEVGLYSSDMWMVPWTFTETGLTTKMDLET